MKIINKTINILFCCAVLLSTFSCEDYLDKKDATDYIQEEEIFDDPIVLRSYADRLYMSTAWWMEGRSSSMQSGSFKVLSNSFHVDGEGVMGRPDYPMNSQFACGKYDVMVENNFGNNEMYYCWDHSWEGIYQANIILSKIDDACKNSDKELEEDIRRQIKAEALTIRAISYDEIIKRWGGVPYFRNRITPATDKNIKRTPYDTIANDMIKDLDEATKIFPKVAYMDDPINFGRLGKASAMALKSRMLTEMASPLHNPSGDKQKWIRAAQAAWDVIKLSFDNPDQIGLYKGKYSDIFYDTQGTIEGLWPRSYQQGSPQVVNSFIWRTKLLSSNAGGFCTSPTQELVDKFETADGYPIIKGYESSTKPIYYPNNGYDKNNPYINRDPRFELDILHQGSPFVQTATGQTIDVVYDPVNKIYGRERPMNTGYAYYCCNTGYLVRKMLPERFNMSTTYSNARMYYNPPYIRMAEMYLNYAEAVAEAYGDAKASLPGATMTAEDAVNAVRNRVGHCNVRPEFVSDINMFKDRVRNEFCIELCFEGGYWFNYLKRWKLAVQELDGRKFTGVYVIPDSSMPTGYRYERYEVSPLTTPSGNVFKERQYYYPFRRGDMQLNPNLEQNPGWPEGR